MSDQEQWGPWVEHIPGPCPIPLGAHCQVQCHNRDGSKPIKQGKMTERAANYPSWVMVSHTGPYNMVLRYRIRKPRGLTILEKAIRDLPADAPKVTT